MRRGMTEPEEDKALALRRALGLKPRERPSGEPVRPARDAATPSRERGASRRAEAVSPAEVALGSSQADLLLRDVLRRHEALPGKPARLPWLECLHLARTHGLYFGNGEGKRRLQLGFRPEQVVFVTPTAEQVAAPPEPETLLEDGFVVGEALNATGFAYLYVVFRA